MDITLLRYFYTVAKEGSFMAAAEKLDYAQSNLSMRIKQLEKTVGAELLIRSRNGVSLTEKGRILFGYAEKILSLSEEADYALREAGYQTKSLTIAAMESAAVTFLPALLSDYHRAYPDISVKVTAGTTDADVQAVLANDVDAAIVVGENAHEELCAVPLRQEKLVLIVDQEAGGTQDLPELLKKPLLVFTVGCSYRRLLERMLSDFGLAPVDKMEFTSLGAILASISAGLGISVFPETAVSAFSAGKALCTIPLPDKYATADLYLVYRKRSAGNKTLMNFIDTLKGEP